MSSDPIDIGVAELDEPSAAEPNHDEFLGQLYALAIAPERIDALVANWAKTFDNANTGGISTTRHRALEFSLQHALPHLDRAEATLKAALKTRDIDLDSVAAWVNNKKHAAFALNSTGIAVAANATAKTAFGIVEGFSARNIFAYGPEPGASALIWPPRKTTQIAWLRSKPTGEPYVATISQQIVTGCDAIGVTVNFIEWPSELSSLLATTYGLTAAEIELLKALTRGNTINEVAEVTKRSTATLRSHVKSMLNKTQTRGQFELIRFCIGLMSILDKASTDQKVSPSSNAVANTGRRTNNYQIVKLSDGRDFSYLETGDPNGRPFLLYPCPMGFFRFPRAIEDGFARQGLRMIVPLRATLGPTSNPPKDRSVIDVMVTSTLELVDALGIEKAPAVCLWMDLLTGVTLANRQPDRVPAVIGAAPLLPVVEDQHIARLDALSRFYFAQTRVLPKILNIVSLAFLYLGHIAGPERFVRATLKTSSFDLALLDDPEMCEALTLGTPSTNVPGYGAHEACHKEIEAYCGDWREALVKCKSPVILMAGANAPAAPVETMYDFAARSANITPIVFPNTGLLVMHQHTGAVIAEVKKWL